MSRIRSGTSEILCGLVVLLWVGAAQAQTCPCWTPAELAAIRVQPHCACENNLVVDNPDILSCTWINAIPEGGIGTPCQGQIFEDSGLAGAWRGTAVEGVDGCWLWDPLQGIGQSDRLITGLTPAEIEACALEVAALGEAAEDNFCAVDLASCRTDADCASLGLCSVDGNPCQSDADCPSPIGTCTQDPSVFCQTNEDCAGFLNLCQNLQGQGCGSNANTCMSGTPSCLDECFPPECRILPTSVVIEFTQQQFDSVYGLLSELQTDADFSRATCDPLLSTDSWALPPDPAIGDGQYFLLRAVEGVSCTDHGHSTMILDPRDVLDASCP